MKKKVLTLILLVSVIFLFKCRKSEDTIKGIGNAYKNALINWMDLQKDNNLNGNEFIDTLKREALWESATIEKINLTESIIYIPIKYNSNKTGLVFVIKNQNNHIETGFISEITKDVKLKTGSKIKSAYIIDAPENILLGFYKCNLNSFTGSIKGYKINNSLLWEKGYINGSNIYTSKISNQLSIYSNQKPNTQGIQNGNSGNDKKTMECTSFYLVTYWSDGSADYTYLGGFCDGSSCQLLLILTQDSSKISANCYNGSTPVIGGGGSPTSTNSITNNIKDPCLSALVNYIINNNLKNEISNILVSVFSMSNTVNVDFEQANIVLNKNGNPVDAKTDGNVGGIVPNAPLNETVYLSLSGLTGASKEFQASVVIHEIIHTSLNVMGIQDSLQHPLMLANCVNEIKYTLQTYYPYLTDDEANSLALYGFNDIANTPAFQQVITNLGFDTNSNSRNNFALYAQQFEAGQLGSVCSSSNGTITPTL